MIYTFTDLYSDTSEYKKGRKKGSRNKRRRVTVSQQPELTEDEKFRRSRALRQNVDTGLRGSREIRSWLSLARAFA